MKFSINTIVLPDTNISLDVFPFGFYAPQKNKSEILKNMSVDGAAAFEGNLYINMPVQSVLKTKDLAAADHSELSANFKEYMTALCAQLFKAPTIQDIPSLPFAPLSAEDALVIGVVLAGSVFRLQNHTFVRYWMEQFIESDEFAHYSQLGCIADHPCFPAYLMSCQTYKIENLNIIKYNIFNKYGEYIGTTSESSELLGGHELVINLIPDLGLSPSPNEWNNQYLFGQSGLLA